METYNKYKKIFFFLILFFFSILFNQYYGYIGILPIDSFLVFNGGYDFLNGKFPFIDYWTIKEPLLDAIQAIFFKIFGVSWFSYVLHASVFNFIIAISTFYTLNKFGLSIEYSFLYSILVSILAYPAAGTPFSDHHVTIFSIIALFCFILSLKTDKKIYWFFLPVFFGFAFLSKQAPSAYFLLIISALATIYFCYNFDYKKIFFGFLGSFIFILIFLILLKIGNISLISFYEQYFLFPQSLGVSRLEWLFPLEFNRIVLRFKLIYLVLFPLFVIIIKESFNNYKFLKSNDSLIIFSLVLCSFFLIIHQLMTINAKFIFFIIPIMAGFSHIYSKKYFKNKNYILHFLVILSISSTVYYHETYIKNRKFMDLDKINLKNAIDAKSLDIKFNKLKWITNVYPENPRKEIELLKEAISIIKADKRNKILVTDYQFISVLLSIYDNSPVRFWYEYHGYPTKENKYHSNYRNFFIDKLKNNKIEIVYTIKPLYGDKNVLKDILEEDCLIKETHTKILDSKTITKCESLNN